jgi:nucleoid DNA-binding protein
LEDLVTFKDLVASIGEDTGIPSTKVASVLHSLALIVKAEVMSGAKVKMWKFGTFYGIDTRELVFGNKVQTRKKVKFMESRYNRKK